MNLSIDRSIDLSTYRSIYLSRSHVSIYPSTYLSNYLPLSLICVSIYLSILFYSFLFYSFLFFSILFYSIYSIYPIYPSIYLSLYVSHHSQDEKILKHTSMLLFLSFEFERITSKAKSYAVHVWSDLSTCGAIGLGTC